MEDSYTVCASGDVRLVGPNNATEGRLEVCVNNQWGTVCDDAWSLTSAALTCQMLNKSGGEIINPIDFANIPTSPILLDDVKCTGSEVNLLSCPQLPLSSPHDCRSDEAVAIRCQGQCSASPTYYV